KLKGSWHLVMMKGEERQWLLMKGKDEFSGPKVVFDENSILTGLDFAGIEKGDAIWHSDRSDNKPGRATKKPAKKSDSQGNSKTKTDPAFTPDDLAEAKRVSKFPTD